MVFCGKIQRITSRQDEMRRIYFAILDRSSEELPGNP